MSGSEEMSAYRIRGCAAVGVGRSVGHVMSGFANRTMGVPGGTSPVPPPPPVGAVFQVPSPYRTVDAPARPVPSRAAGITPEVICDALIVFAVSAVLSTFPSPTIALVTPVTVPVNAGLAVGAFPSRASCNPVVFATVHDPSGTEGACVNDFTPDTVWSPDSFTASGSDPDPPGTIFHEPSPNNTVDESAVPAPSLAGAITPVVICVADSATASTPPGPCDAA